MTKRKPDALVPSAGGGPGALTKRPQDDLVARGLADLEALEGAAAETVVDADDSPHLAAVR